MWLQINTYLDLELNFPELILGWIRRVAKGGEEGGEDSPPARLKQVQFALNRKHAFSDATP